MFCNQCGEQNPDEAASCIKCGNPLTTIFPVQPMSASNAGVAVAAAPAVYASGQPIAPLSPDVLPPVEPQTDGKATASLVLGILSMTCFGFLTGIPAVILGHMSRSNIKKSMGKLKGDGMALAGLIMGYISVAVIPVVVLIIAAIAIPNLLKARTAANEATAAGSVRTVVSASMAYQADKGSYPVSLDQLRDANLIDPTLASGTKSGYKLSFQGTGEHLFVEAVPATRGSTGNRTFCSAEDGVIRYVTGSEPCTPESPILE
jgi:competence protein ComGC